jgi:peptide/nickel transport system substrate-binding protein
MVTFYHNVDSNPRKGLEMITVKGLTLATLAVASIATGAVAQDIVRIASPNKVTTLDPIASAAAGNIEAFGQLYARLLRKDADGTLQPGLAESWTISDDGLTYTFELRDAKFSDGSDITAEDVAFSLNRVAKDEGSSYPAAYAPVRNLRPLMKTRCN